MLAPPWRGGPREGDGDSGSDDDDYAREVSSADEHEGLASVSHQLIDKLPPIDPSHGASLQRRLVAETQLHEDLVPDSLPLLPQPKETSGIEVLADALNLKLFSSEQPLFRDRSRQRLHEWKRREREEAERLHMESEQQKQAKEAEHQARLRRIEKEKKILHRLRQKRARREEKERLLEEEKRRKAQEVAPKRKKARKLLAAAAREQRLQQQQKQEEERERAAAEKHKQALEAERKATEARERARQRVIERLHQQHHHESVSATDASDAEVNSRSAVQEQVARGRHSNEAEESQLAPRSNVPHPLGMNYQQKAQERLRQHAVQRRKEREKHNQEYLEGVVHQKERSERLEHEAEHVREMARRRAAEHLRKKKQQEEQQRLQEKEAKRLYVEARHRYWKPSAVAERKLMAPPMPTKEEVQRRAVAKRRQEKMELKHWMHDHLEAAGEQHPVATDTDSALEDADRGPPSREDHHEASSAAVASSSARTLGSNDAQNLLRVALLSKVPDTDPSKEKDQTNLAKDDIQKEEARSSNIAEELEGASKELPRDTEETREPHEEDNDSKQTEGQGSAFMEGEEVKNLEANHENMKGGGTEERHMEGDATEVGQEEAKIDDGIEGEGEEKDGSEVQVDVSQAAVEEKQDDCNEEGQTNNSHEQASGLLGEKREISEATELPVADREEENEEEEEEEEPAGVLQEEEETDAIAREAVSSAMLNAEEEEEEDDGKEVGPATSSSSLALSEQEDSESGHEDGGTTDHPEDGP